MKPVTTSRPPILLIEDTLSLQMVYRSILTSAGHRVVTASNATEGLEQFRQVRPELVLLDLILPDRDGVDLMRDMLAYLPEADVIVNPNQPGCEFPSKNLAGVGVIFYVMRALRAELRSRLRSLRRALGPARPTPGE